MLSGEVIYTSLPQAKNTPVAMLIADAPFWLTPQPDMMQD
jgi:hypothetical protein